MPQLHSLPRYQSRGLAGAPLEGARQRRPADSLVPFVSADGIRWRMLRQEPVLTQGAFDSQNIAFWDSARPLRAHFRGFPSGSARRAHGHLEDFIH